MEEGEWRVVTPVKEEESNLLVDVNYDEGTDTFSQ